MADESEDAEYDSVLCVDMINGWTDVSDYVKQSMIDEILYPEYIMCPQVSSMKILGGDLGEVNFNLEITAKT